MHLYEEFLLHLVHGLNGLKALQRQTLNKRCIYNASFVLYLFLKLEFLETIKSIGIKILDF